MANTVISLSLSLSCNKAASSSYSDWNKKKKFFCRVTAGKPTEWPVFYFTVEREVSVCLSGAGQLPPSLLGAVWRWLSFILSSLWLFTVYWMTTGWASDRPRFHSMACHILLTMVNSPIVPSSSLPEKQPYTTQFQCPSPSCSSGPLLLLSYYYYTIHIAKPVACMPIS